MGKNRGGLVVLSAKVEAGLAAEVRRIAAQQGETVSKIVERLLVDALEDGADERIAADLADVGYQDGLRRGLHEVRVHMKKLFAGGDGK